MEMDSRIWRGTAVSFLLLLICGCGSDESQESEARNSTPIDSVKTMELTSSGFDNSAKMDAKYTIEGQDHSPPLFWLEAPQETESFALLCEDPDAPSPRNPAKDPWVHWIIFNIPGDCSNLPEGIGRKLEPDELPGASQGRNSWSSDNVGYRGPAPPPGSGPHRYFFKLYCLDTMLELSAGATKRQLLKAMSGHVLAEGQLVGLYER
jgi:hypothetical protein